MSEPIKIELQRLASGPIVVVHFDDGHAVSFMPAYDSGPRSGDPVSIAQLKIENPAEEPIAKFFSPFQSPIVARNISGNGPEYGFQPLLQPYLSLEEIVDYLRKAQAYVGAAFTANRRFAEHVNIVHLAHHEISRIAAGDFELPAQA